MALRPTGLHEDGPRSGADTLPQSAPWPAFSREAGRASAVDQGVRPSPRLGLQGRGLSLGTLSRGPRPGHSMPVAAPPGHTGRISRSAGRVRYSRIYARCPSSSG
jgi:hypothetical protein